MQITYVSPVRPTNLHIIEYIVYVYGQMNLYDETIARAICARVCVCVCAVFCCLLPELPPVDATAI